MDIFSGIRLAFNDVSSTEILVGGIVDLTNASQIYSIEASRRIKDSWRIEVEGRFLNNISMESIPWFYRDDSFVKTAIYKYF